MQIINFKTGQNAYSASLGGLFVEVRQSSNKMKQIALKFVWEFKHLEGVF